MVTALLSQSNDVKYAWFYNYGLDFLIFLCCAVKLYLAYNWIESSASIACGIISRRNAEYIHHWIVNTIHLIPLGPLTNLIWVTYYANDELTYTFRHNNATIAGGIEIRNVGQQLDRLYIRWARKVIASDRYPSSSTSVSDLAKCLFIENWWFQHHYCSLGWWCYWHLHPICQQHSFSSFRNHLPNQNIEST